MIKQALNVVALFPRQALFFFTLKSFQDAWAGGMNPLSGQRQENRIEGAAAISANLRS